MGGFLDGKNGLLLFYCWSNAHNAAVLSPRVLTCSRVDVTHMTALQGLTDEETKEIKVLSRAGNFQLIREKYGDKWEANARKWLERKGLAGGAQVRRGQ